MEGGLAPRIENKVGVVVQIVAVRWAVKKFEVSHTKLLDCYRCSQSRSLRSYPSLSRRECAMSLQVVVSAWIRNDQKDRRYVKLLSSIHPDLQTEVPT